MKKNIDSESIATVGKKLDIVNATNELCVNQSFKSLTVDKISELAEVSSSTFYRLFNGKNDIPLWYLRFSTDSSISCMGTLFTCEQALTLMLGLMERCRPLFDSVKDTLEMNMVDRVETQRVCDLILQNIRDYHDIEPDEGLRYEALWATTAGIVLSGEWLHNPNDEPVEKLAHYFADCYSTRLRDILDAPPVKQPQSSASVAAVLALISAQAGR